MKVRTKEAQSCITPLESLQFLKEGNRRFQANLKENGNVLEQINETTEGQYPFATVLSCMDSRVPTELVFDQGLGDIFCIRIAGNFVNDDVLGSMEFACKLAGTKLVVVLGHTNCGAIRAACEHARMGNLTGIIDRLEPSVNAVKEPKDEKLRNSHNLEFVDRVSEQNVLLTIENIRNNSDILFEMEKNAEIKIIGAMYDITTGGVSFYEQYEARGLAQ